MSEPQFANVTIDGPHGPIPAYLATPSTPGPWPGVVVIHDAIGFGSAVKNHADWLAEEGYLAIAPNLFGWGKKQECLKSSFRAVRSREGRQFDDIEAARQFVLDHDGVTDKVGIIGFCMGGAYVLLLAPEADKYAAASVNYGRIPDDAGEFLRGACPIIASYGGNDKSIKNGGERIERALTQAGVEHEVKEYPGAGHMFMDNYPKGEIPFVFATLEKMFGMGYREGPAIDAQRRITAFFARHLKGVGAPSA
jgi:carboxymethylenebutenolidase